MREIARVYVFGAGKLGRALAAALRRAGVAVSLRAARRGWPRRLDADLVVLAVRDGSLRDEAGKLAQLPRTRSALVVLHCAGALPADWLAEIKGAGLAVGKWHPLLAFAIPRQPPPFLGAFALVAGQRRARRAAVELCGWLAMTPVVAERHDATLYHAGAALLANGLVVLMDAAVTSFAAAGLAPATARKMLGPLLASAAANLRAQGPPAALSGPIRRGAVSTVRAHLRALDELAPSVAALYRELARAQLPLAAVLGDASPDALRELAQELAKPVANEE